MVGEEKGNNMKEDQKQGYFAVRDSIRDKCLKDFTDAMSGKHSISQLRYNISSHKYCHSRMQCRVSTA